MWFGIITPSAEPRGKTASWCGEGYIVMAELGWGWSLSIKERENGKQCLVDPEGTDS